MVVGSTTVVAVAVLASCWRWCSACLAVPLQRMQRQSLAEEFAAVVG